MLMHASAPHIAKSSSAAAERMGAERSLCTQGFGERQNWGARDTLGRGCGWHCLTGTETSVLAKKRKFPGIQIQTRGV